MERREEGEREEGEREWETDVEREGDQRMYILQGVLAVSAASLDAAPLEGRSSREQGHHPGRKPRQHSAQGRKGAHTVDISVLAKG